MKKKINKKIERTIKRQILSKDKQKNKKSLNNSHFMLNELGDELFFFK